MWIQVKPEYRETFATQRLCDAEGTAGHVVTFTATGKAQVPEVVAEQMLAHYDLFESTDTDEDEDDTADSDTTSDTTSE